MSDPVASLEEYRVLLSGFVTGEVAPPWTLQDARALAGFLRTDLGVKLQLQIQFQCLAASERAIEYAATQHAAGEAYGMRGIWGLLKALSVVPTESGDETSDDDAPDLEPESPS